MFSTPVAAATVPDLAARCRAAQPTLRALAEARETLIDMVRAVNSSLDPTRIAELVVDRAAAWIPGPLSWAVVTTDHSEHLSIVARPQLSPESTIAVHDVSRWVVVHGTELFSANLKKDERIGSSMAASVLAFPLVSRARTIGVLLAIDERPSSRTPEVQQGVLRALRILLEPAAAALDSMIRLRSAAALSVTDDLTGLYNSRYLNQVLRRETKRAMRSARPLSLLFLDLDDFKTVNDRHGHLCGSRALVEAAEVIRSSARETDVVARFGGDEFALVLPDTGAAGGFSVGERVRDRIARHAFLEKEGLVIRLTASVGVATLPDVASGAEELIKAADTAMYRVKDHGKNGIEAATIPADN